MITRKELADIISTAVSAGYAVCAPRKREGRVYLEQITDGAALETGHVITVNGIKDVLLPRCEPLLGFGLDEVNVKPVEEPSVKRIILGTRPCDAASLVVLDSILLEPVRDSRYAKRREKTTVVTIACSRADDACFCTSMGFGPHDETGSDVLLLPSEDSYIVRALTDRGRALLADVGLEADTGGVPDSPPEVVRKVDTDGLKEWLDGNFENEKWQDVSINCISCGVCYYLCPTCHCFDITDEAGVAKGERYRIWDCCSFSGFTKMAEHQPRVGRHARYRQRIMHKFKYTVDNVGLVACVGDGRCIRHCPAGVDMGEILERLKSEG